MRDIHQSGVSIWALEFLSRGAYLLYLDSFTTKGLRSSTSSKSKPCAIQDLQGFVPLSKGLELESEFVLVVVLCQGLECLLVVEEVLEDPQLA
jgi:hypothetical protein